MSRIKTRSACATCSCLGMAPSLSNEFISKCCKQLSAGSSAVKASTGLGFTPSSTSRVKNDEPMGRCGERCEGGRSGEKGHKSLTSKHFLKQLLMKGYSTYCHRTFPWTGTLRGLPSFLAIQRRQLKQKPGALYWHNFEGARKVHTASQHCLPKGLGRIKVVKFSQIQNAMEIVDP